MDSETLQHARFYLSKGLHPIPVEYRGKRPQVKWEKYQTTPPTDAELVSWFGGGGQPRNIGIVLGRGKFAVDFDGPGAEQLLTAAGVTLPEDAPRSITGNGFHVFFSAPTDIGDRVALLAAPSGKPAIDIRGRGYVVAPPSVHASGHVYAWEQRPDTLPAAPQALLDLLERPLARPQSHATASAPSDLTWVTDALQGVGEGRRDATCARLAGYYLSKGLPEDVVRASLYAFADRCTPPFSHADVDKTVLSVNRRETAQAAAAGTDSSDPTAPFQILGYNQGGYYYLPRGSRQVVELRAEQHSKLQLLRLAPMSHWERAYPSKAGPVWDMAANALIRRAEAIGVYDTARVRGRGAWWDTDHAVLHLGDSLITDGVSTPIYAVAPGRYIYEAASPMPVDLGDPLTADAANQVVQIAEMFTWERPISARLLAGWCAVAPICGALTWRPHVWVTGPAGSGKSWVMDNYIKPLLGGVGLSVQGETTEAGLRQTLGHDARPIVFDEAEGQNERAQMRIQNILNLARQASSETGAVIIKGSPLGAAKVYRIRSCFAFSSIGVGVQQHADATRVSVLSIEKRDVSTDPDAADRFARLQVSISSTITEDFVRRFIARSIRLAPVIRANARTFATAGAAAIGSQRMGDQVGALLAGAYSLYQDGLITPDAAATWVTAQDWTEQRSVQEETDEASCLRRILEHVIHVQTRSYVGQRSIAELIRIAGAEEDGENVSRAAASEILGRHGIRVDNNVLVQHFTISSSHTAIARILDGTPWRTSWARVLRRLPGSMATTAPVRFGPAGRGRGVEIPFSEVE